jgi:D-sedoheptulose 7-phosphate isomerase
MSMTIHEYIISVLDSITEDIPLAQIGQAAKLIEKAAKLHQRVWLVGNGGSAATAMHFSNDLQKMCGVDTLSVPSMIPTALAYGNDDGWHNMFSYAMGAFKVGDILVAISCGGSSQNVINAAKYASKQDGKLIILTGGITVKNELAEMPGIIISIESDDIKVVEDVHMIVCHAIAGAVQDVMRSVEDKLPE